MHWLNETAPRPSFDVDAPSKRESIEGDTQTNRTDQMDPLDDIISVPEMDDEPPEDDRVRIDEDISGRRALFCRLVNSTMKSTVTTKEAS